MGLVDVDLPLRALHEEPLLAVHVARGRDPGRRVDAGTDVLGGEVLPGCRQGYAVLGGDAERDSDTGGGVGCNADGTSAAVEDPLCEVHVVAV